MLVVYRFQRIRRAISCCPFSTPIIFLSVHVLFKLRRGLLLLLLLQNLYIAQIQASSSQRRWRIARWGTWLAGNMASHVKTKSTLKISLKSKMGTSDLRTHAL